MDVDYDEEAAIKAALALSMATAKEDDKRRKEKWGINSPTVTTPDSHAEAAYRMPGSRVSAPPSVPLPVPQPHMAQGQLKKQVSQPLTKSSPPSSSIARPRPQSSKPHLASGLAAPLPSVTMQATSGEKGAPPPLPHYGPNAISSQYLSSVTEGTLTALQPPPRSPGQPRRKADYPTRNSLNQNMFEPKPLISLSPPQDLFDFDISSLDPLSSKVAVQNSDHTSGNPFKEPASKGITIRNPMFDLHGKGSLPLPSTSGKGSASIGVQNSRNIHLFSSSNEQQQPSGLGRPHGSTGSLSALGNASIQGRTTPTFEGHKGIPTMNTGGLYANLSDVKPVNPQPYCISGVTPSVPSPSSSTPPYTTDGAASQSSSHSSTPTPSSNASSTPQVSTASSTSGDLMDFGMWDEDDPSHDFLSLEMFDPLYRVDSLATRGADSFENLAGSKSDNEDEDDPSCEAEIPAGGDVQLEEENNLNAPPRERSQSSDSVGELQDPFEMSALTTALEKKRAKHAAEQEKRDNLLRHKEGARPHVEAARRQGIIRRNSHMERGKEATYETLQEFSETADEEIRAFCQMVASVDHGVMQQLKQQRAHNDPVTNRGLVLSTRLKHPPYQRMTVKLVVHTDFSKEPVTFTCDLELAVEVIISQVLLNLTDDLSNANLNDYIIKVHGLSEYMSNDSKLGDYEYVQNCLKLDQDIRLILRRLDDVPKSLLRTADDDKQPVFVPKHRETDVAGMKVTREKMNILMENFYREVEKLRDNALQYGLHQVQCKSVIQSVKAVCAVLSKIETIDVIKAVNRLQSVTIDKALRPASPNDREAFVYVTEEGEGVCSVIDSESKRLVEEAPHNSPDPLLSRNHSNGLGLGDLDDLHAALEEVTQSVKSLIEMYCRTFHTDFRFESAANVVREKKSLCSVRETLILHVASLHRIPLKWRSSFVDFKVVCGLYMGGRRLCDEVNTQVTPSFTENFQDTLIWDEWIQFESVTLAALPRETRLVFVLYGIRTVKSGAEEGQKITTPLGWVALQVFNHKFELAQGSQLLGLWPGESANPTGTSQSNTEAVNSVLIQVNLPAFDFDVVFPPVGELDPSLYQDFTSLHPSDQDRLNVIIQRSVVSRMSRDHMEYLWEKRHYLHNQTGALPKVLSAAPSWSYTTLVETYSMIVGWKPLSPIEAFELLQTCYADTHVRTTAVKWLRDLPDDELSNFLPQLVQALKFESYHNTALARFLLERSVTSIRIAHQLYWQLKEAAEDVRYRKRYQLVFGALLSVVGAAMRREFSKQEDLVKMLAAIAEKVKAAKDKDAVLQRELDNMFDFLQRESIHLPINPSMEITGVDAKSCSYFTSNAFPLKLVLKNVDPKAEPIYTMFKVGDDLRQDMLTMQLVSIMDKLWLRDGLDLKIITFRCQATGPKRGLVELVTESETLRKIQVKHGHGLTGSFKNRTIAEWLQLQNPTELEYQKAVDNFVASCAGYCVATYVLGIGDRHNDNIMIKQSGHMFHIDFGKFLGDAQMFGNIKRDRVPFVLTSDMAYVINGGDRPSHKFQQFVDLCCQAFNILRQHSRLFLNLFLLMTRSGIPGVNEHAAKYVQTALLPEHTAAEATAIFTRMIEESLKSISTQINFFFHNLAQLKFSGHNEGALLSFIPKTYSIATDGKIKNIEVFGYQKRYNPEKYYIYIIKVDRENQKVPSFIFRRYSEFQEFHQKLIVLFPLAKLPNLAGKVLIGRTHVKVVADARKSELEKFLRQLLQLAPEISECDLVYTFFHPMLRDEQDIDKNLHKLREDPAPRPSNRTIQGQVKLSIAYKNSALVVMIMHVKDLGVEGDELPSPYVKTYILPDQNKYTKRKTRIVKGTFHPTFNEELIYNLPLDAVRHRTLQVTVWNYNALEENDFFGACHIRLGDLDLTKETVEWYRLQTLHTLSTS